MDRSPAPAFGERKPVKSPSRARPITPWPGCALAPELTRTRRHGHEPVTGRHLGDGFVVDDKAAGADRIKVDDTPVTYPFTTGVDLLAHTRATGLGISDIMLANELAWRSEADVRSGLL